MLGVRRGTVEPILERFLACRARCGSLGIRGACCPSCRPISTSDVPPARQRRPSRAVEWSANGRRDLARWEADVWRPDRSRQHSPVIDQLVTDGDVIASTTALLTRTAQLADARSSSGYDAATAADTTSRIASTRFVHGQT